MREKVLEILDRNTSCCAASGDSREIGGMQSKLVHARSHPGRHVAGARRMRRHRQAAHRGRNCAMLWQFVGLFPGPVLFAGRAALWLTEAKTRGVLFAGL